MSTCRQLLGLAMGLGLLLESGQPAHSEPPRTDLFGDPLPPGAITRIGTERFRHRGSIYSLAYSPDGKLIASGDSFETPARSSIAVWDAATGKQLHRLEGHGHVVRWLAFAPDSRRLAAACGDGSLRIWDTTAEKEIVKIKESSFESAAFTPDGKAVAASHQHGVGVWDAATGRKLAHMSGLRELVRFVAISPDGKHLAGCGQYGTVLLWERETAKEVRRFKLDAKYGGQVAFSPDGKRLVFGAGERICLWDVATGAEVRRIQTEDGRLPAQPFRCGGAILVSYGDNIRLWNVATGEEVRHIDSPRNQLTAAALSPDGKVIVMGCRHATLRLWDAATGKELQHRDGHDRGVLSVYFSPDGKAVATASGEPVFRLWDAASGQPLRTFSTDGHVVRCLAFSRDGNTLAGSLTYNSLVLMQPVSLWDVKSGRHLRRLAEKGWGSQRVAFSADGTTLAANLGPARVVLWDAATGKARAHPFKSEVNPFLDSFDQYSDFVLAPDGKTLIVACYLNSHAYLVLWDAAKGKQRFAIRTSEGKFALYPEVPADFSSDGRRIATLRDKAVQVREAASGQVVRILEGHGDTVLCAAFSPDGRFLVSAGRDRTIRLWDMATGKQQRKWQGHQDAIRCVAFSADGKRLASASDDLTALIWRIKVERSSEKPRPRLSNEQFHLLLEKLSGTDAASAEKAIWDLVLASDRAVELFKDGLHPVPPIAAERVAVLVAKLDSDDFATREKAQKDLLNCGEGIVPVLRKTIGQDRPSLELRRRIEHILALFNEWDTTSDGRRMLRILDVLEHIDTPSARHLLERLAGGVAEARLTREAKACLTRLARHPARK